MERGGGIDLGRFHSVGKKEKKKRENEREREREREMQVRRDEGRW